jgi:serine/threonine-protein kinase
LSSILKRLEHAGESLPLAMHLRVISAALEGLHYAHELADYDGSPIGLVHRDVSPHNLFLTYDGQVKVLDFGIAKAATSSSNTATGIIKGKIAYMAPEQMIGDALDRRADLYSIGCMLWAAAVGQKLWRDTPDVQIMRRVINAEVPSPQSVNANCKDELNRIVLKAMSWDASERYATALELQSDLDQYLDAQSEQAKPKQIGNYVSTLFADTRAELKAVVERQLALVSELQGLDDSSQLKLRGTSPELSDTPSSSEARRLAQLLEPKPRRAWWPFLVIVPLVLGAVLWLGIGYGTRSVNSPASGVAAGPAAFTPSPLLSATVSMRAQPPSARLFLDEQPLSQNPISMPLVLDGSPRRLRAEAAGYQSGEVTFVATRDRQVEVLLKPVIAEPSALPSATGPSKSHSTTTPGKGRTPGASVTKPVPGPKSNPSCDQPFFVDSSGIRKLRPECI